jgi:hypothetical protein
MGVLAGPAFAALGAYATTQVVAYAFTVFFTNLILSGHEFVDENGDRWIIAESK